MRFGLSLDSSSYNCYGVMAWLASHHPEVFAEIERRGGKLEHFKWLSVNTNLLQDTPPIPGTAEYAGELKDRKISLGIATHRASPKDPHYYYQDGPKITREWLVRFGIPFDFIEFTGEKAAAIAKIEGEAGCSAEVYVEDHPANIIETLEAGYRVAFPDKTYNQADLISEDADPISYGNGRFTQEKWTNTLRSPRVHRIKHLRDISDLVA